MYALCSIAEREDRAWFDRYSKPHRLRWLRASERKALRWLDPEVHVVVLVTDLGHGLRYRIASSEIPQPDRFSGLVAVNLNTLRELFDKRDPEMKNGLPVPIQKSVPNTVGMQINIGGLCGIAANEDKAYFATSGRRHRLRYITRRERTKLYRNNPKTEQHHNFLVWVEQLEADVLFYRIKPTPNQTLYPPLPKPGSAEEWELMSAFVFHVVGEDGSEQGFFVAPKDWPFETGPSIATYPKDFEGHVLANSV